MSGPAQVLALNSGSSSLKFGLYGVSSASAEALISGGAETAGSGRRRFWAHGPGGRELASEDNAGLDQEGTFRRLAEIIAAQCSRAPDAVGHRIVHGGARLRRHCLIDAAV